MSIKEYLIIENNVVTNNVVWDGDTQSWMPPTDATMLVTATTPALVWELNMTVSPSIYELTQVIGAGGIGFTWDAISALLTTNASHPEAIAPKANQPTTTGTQTL